MHYVLRVQGHLDPSWSDRFGGLRIEPQEAGTTLLSGSVPDQAALHGLLLQIVRLGLVLLELSTSEANGAEAAADRRPAESPDAESSRQCQCDCWMAAKFDTYLAEYQHGLCFSFVRGVSFTGQSKNFPESRKPSMGSVRSLSKTTPSSHHMYILILVKFMLTIRARSAR